MQVYGVASQTVIAKTKKNPTTTTTTTYTTTTTTTMEKKGDTYGRLHSLLGFFNKIRFSIFLLNLKFVN